MSKHILIIEDEEDIIELIKYNIAREGYESNALSTGLNAVEIIAKTPPDLILLDLMLPGLSGLEICKALKLTPSTQDIPIIMISAKSEDADIVTGLELGADDYITKPFSPRILTARIKSVLRRQGNTNQKSQNEDEVNIGALTLSNTRREAKLDGKVITLTFSEFQTLYLLAKNPGRVYTRYQIVEEVHGNDYAVTDRSIDVLIVSIRKKLGYFAEKIETIRGVGYRFKDSPNDQ